MQFVVVLVAFFAAHHAAAQNTTFLKSPVFLWDTDVAPVGEGNECTLAPAAYNPLLLCSSVEGIVTAVSTGDATTAWDYKPNAVSTMSSTSGITFSSNGTFFVYGTTDFDGTSSIWYVLLEVCKCSVMAFCSLIFYRFFPVACML
jgi:hypothetical protein